MSCCEQCVLNYCALQYFAWNEINSKCIERSAGVRDYRSTNGIDRQYGLKTNAFSWRNTTFDRNVHVRLSTTKEDAAY